jgi:hypothetical protein
MKLMAISHKALALTITVLPTSVFQQYNHNDM